MKTAIGHTNVYSSYGWLILARVRVLYVPNGYGSFLCLVYATTVVIYYLADFVHIWYNITIGYDLSMCILYRFLLKKNMGKW